eukprot:m.134175 g.134175  ORF g.134175 m.134175 type:complete len:54 (-) comp15971_c0_seq7:3757-3918(-)
MVWSIENTSHSTSINTSTAIHIRNPIVMLEHSFLDLVACTRSTLALESLVQLL